MHREKNGKLRICIDFRSLNKHALREPYNQSPIIDIVQRINADKACFFSSADATAGYNQCNLDEDSRDLTTFITKFGRYRYKRAPFGDVSISDHFNRRMDELFRDLPCMARVVDDSLIYGSTEEELARNTIRYLERCREHGVRLLMSKTPVVELNEEERRAFVETKSLLSSAAVLAYFRPGRPMEVYTDAACTKGFGFDVRQLQPDNQWRPLMLGSRALSDAETRYAPIEAEVTAMAWALRKARKFLLGAPRFKVYTDHRPLVSLVNSKRYDVIANSRILRNVLKCRDFNMEVEYVNGSSNVIADSLSRAPASKPDAEDTAEAEETSHQIRTMRVAAIQDAEMPPQEEEILEWMTEVAFCR
jgi:hypothetical protein